MIEKAETEYKELIHKKKVVENDKKKIEDVIDELDQKKNQTLQVHMHSPCCSRYLHDMEPWSAKPQLSTCQSFYPAKCCVVSALL